MRMLGCLGKSALTLMMLAVALVLIAGNLPEDAPWTPWTPWFAGVLLPALLLAWVGLTVRWFLQARAGSRAPATPRLQIELPSRSDLPRWVVKLALLVILCIAAVFGILVILHSAGVSVPVMVGAIVGPGIAVLWHRRRTRAGRPLGEGQQRLVGSM